MQFWSAALFVFSSGLIYYERYRGNKLVLGLAVILAVSSSISFIYSFWPATMSSPPLNVAPAAALPDNAETAVTENDSTADGDPFASSCDWEGGETISRCIDRLSRTRSRRNATYIAFYHRGTDAMLARAFESADNDFGVALDNSSEATEPIVRLTRGMNRVYLENYAGALDDCDRVNNPRAMDLLRTVVPSPRGQAFQLDNWLSFCRGIALSKMGRHREALPLLDSAINGNFVDRQIYEARANSREALGDGAGAESDRMIWVSMTVDGLTSKAGNSDATGNAAQ